MRRLALIHPYSFVLLLDCRRLFVALVRDLQLREDPCRRAARSVSYALPDGCYSAIFIGDVEG